MYIALEGIDTTGKSTQMARLEAHYPHAIFTKEPYDEKIRELALHGNFDNLARTFLFLADRAKHAREVLNPNKTKLIFSDRSMISGIAYASEIPLERAIELNCEVAPVPNLAFIFTTSKELLRARLGEKKVDSIEAQGIEKLLEIQSRMIESTKILKLECEIIDSSLDIESITRAIIARIERL